MGSEIEQLRNEIEVLKEDYRSLEGEVRRLRRAIAGLRAPERHPGYPESEESYSFLEGTVGRSSVAPSWREAWTLLLVDQWLQVFQWLQLLDYLCPGLVVRRSPTALVCGPGGLLLVKTAALVAVIKTLCRADCGLFSAPSRASATTPRLSTRTGLGQRLWWSEGLKQANQCLWAFPVRERPFGLSGSLAWSGQEPTSNDWRWSF